MNVLLERFDLEFEPRLLYGCGVNIFDQNKSFNPAGIYACVCIDNNKIYIGSSETLRSRIKIGHINKLKRKKHDNVLIQRANDLYGEGSILWYLIEEVFDISKLIEREQFYMDLFQSYERNFGFNINKIAGKPPANNRSGIKYTEERKARFMAARRGHSNPFLVKDPQGVIHSFLDSIQDFAIKNDLLPAKLSLLLRGVAKQHKGWTLPETVIKEKEIFSLQSPDGKIFKFTNKMQFVKEHGLTEAGVLKVLDGTYSQCKGWALPGFQKPFREISDPEGNVHKIYSVKEFCEERNLNYKGICAVLQKNTKAHKGWTLKPEPKP